MKVFVSLPITGKEEWARQEAARVKGILEGKGFEVVTPFGCAPEPDRKIGYYMGRCIEALLDCTVICQHPEWYKSQGCRVEEAASKVYGILHIEWPDLNNPKK